MIALVLLAGCGGGSELMVFAAASAGPAVEEAADAWSAASDTAVVTSSAASSTLVRQVQAGARPDVVVLASEDWADALAEGYAEESDLLLTNSVVVIGAPGTTPSLDADGCVAVGDPDHVPVGQYAREVLGPRWEAIADRVVPALDATAGVALVARGECPVGIAYGTDAVRGGVEVGETLAPAVARYPVLRGTSRGEALYDWLGGPEARAVFDRYGFGAP